MDFMNVVALLMNGFCFSLIIFLVTLLIAIPLGLPIAFLSMSRFKAVRAITKTFVWIIRGIPLMLQIMIIFYLPGLLSKGSNSVFSIFSNINTYIVENFNFSQNVYSFENMFMTHVGELLAVLIAFSINYACYFSEIFRGGIESISRGQYEAGYVLGLKKSQVFRKIVLKQVIKRIVPPMSNEIITLIKDTALANCIAIPEIIDRAQYLANKQMIWPLFFAGVFYLIFVGILTILLGKLEKKLSYFRS